MSTYEAPVIEVKLETHPNADSLSIVNIDSFCVVARTESWEGIKLGVYIPPDSIVDASRPEFSFLGSGKVRIKAKRLCGVWSMGLLVPAPDFAKVGDDLYEYLGIEHYEPPETFTMGGCVSAPQRYKQLFKYGMENGRKSQTRRAFQPMELVHVSEKLHGANMSVVFTEGKLWVHSRTQWPEETNGDIFWTAAKQCQPLIDYCTANPDTLVYGEVYGQVQAGYAYDAGNSVKFRAFDILHPDFSFMDVNSFIEVCDKWNIPRTPDFGIHPFDIDKLLPMCLGKSSLNEKCIKEGVVVKPLVSRTERGVGRLIMKLINPEYLEKN